MILLDTNVLSALMRPAPDPAVMRWLDGQPRSYIWIAAVTVLEIRFGLGIMPDGRRAAGLRQAFERLVDGLLEGRIAVFDQAAAVATADLMAERQRRGDPQELRDSMIAGIARARRATVATRNLRHFASAGIGLVDPWNA